MLATIIVALLSGTIGAWQWTPLFFVTDESGESLPVRLMAYLITFLAISASAGGCMLSLALMVMDFLPYDVNEAKYIVTSFQTVSYVYDTMTLYGKIPVSGTGIGYTYQYTYLDGKEQKTGSVDARYTDIMRGEVDSTTVTIKHYYFNNKWWWLIAFPRPDDYIFTFPN